MPSGYIPYPGPPQNITPTTGCVWELGQQAVDSNGTVWICTGRGFAGQPGTAFLEVGGAGSVTYDGTVT